MVLRSFRARIILWYTLILSLTLTLFGFFVYKDFGRRLARNIEDILVTRADGVVDSIESFWEKERIDSAGNGVKLDDLDRLDAAQFSAMAQNWIARKSKDPLFFNILVSIFDRTGREVTSSRTLIRNIPLRSDILAAVLKGGNRINDLEVEMVSGGSTPFRALVFPVTINDRVCYLVRVMTPLASLYSTLRELRLILFFILPIGIILSGSAAGFLAGLTLRPVDKITSTARLINAENLKTRIALPEGRDEIRRLAETFNGMLDRLERSFSSQREFIEDLSHEIKTPLAVMKGELEVTLKKMRSAREYEETLSSSLEETDKIISIVEDLLTLAKFDANVMVLETGRVDIGALVRDTVEEFEIMAEQKKIVIGLSGAEQSMEVMGDRLKLKMVLLNLLGNAVKFTAAGGRIEVGVARDNGSIAVRITDNGTGMSEEQLARIFERFYRARSGETIGTGLGLSIVKSIIEAHLGRIEVGSAPGHGSTFTIMLPAAAPA